MRRIETTNCVLCGGMIVNISKTMVVSAAACFALVTFMAVAGDTSKEAEAIGAVNGAWAGFYNAGDADGVASLYWDDGHLMPPGVPTAKGREAIRDVVATDIGGAKAAGLTMNIDHGPISVSGNLAWQDGTFKVTDTAGTVIDAGKYLSVLEKRNGKWLLLRDIYNSDMAPASAPAAN